MRCSSRALAGGWSCLSLDEAVNKETHEALELELHGEARDAHGGGIRVLAFCIGPSGGEVDKGSVSREHLGDEPVVLLFVRSAGMSPDWVDLGRRARVPKRFVYGACDLSILKVFGAHADEEQRKLRRWAG